MSLFFFLLMAAALVVAGVIVFHVGRDWLSHSVLSSHPAPIDTSH